MYPITYRVSGKWDNIIMTMYNDSIIELLTMSIFDLKLCFWGYFNKILYFNINVGLTGKAANII